MSANNILALDIGERRIGIARADTIARLPEVVGTIHNDEAFTEAFKAILDQYPAQLLVVGLPRNMSGEETLQSQYSKEFAQKYLVPTGLKIVFQDETLSTVTAQTQIKTEPANKSDIDARAAVVILNDYLLEANNEV